jgi:ATP-dependent helicase/nuclease subunit A
MTAQVQASNPRASVFVAANAGSGKTSTLVTRVARLLLAGAPPEAILCVTFTKAGAAEMQTRLFQTLGSWAVMDGQALSKTLADIDEAGRDLKAARALFARALETPGGLKIQTIHAFCEKLLRRFPLEAGVSPGFTVLEDAAAREVSARARDDVARLVLARPDHDLAKAYDHFSVDLDYRSFGAMFADFENKRAEIGAYIAACADQGVTFEADVWRRCGFDAPTDPAVIEQRALKRTRTRRWGEVAEKLLKSDRISEHDLGAGMLGARVSDDFDDLKTLFLTDAGEPRKRLAGSSLPKDIREWLAEEQRHAVEAAQRLCNARLAEESVQALRLATAYAAIYDGAKDAVGALDFGDLIARTLELLTKKADAAWVLYKLDNGIDHVLLDEAQDTAPDQWAILRALTDEFFRGEGAGPKYRTLFAVGDEKQSIFSFQGAAPERLAVETRAFGERIRAANMDFERVPLLESWRSAPEILSFVDQVFADDAARAGLRPAGETLEPFKLIHRPTRTDDGCVELWPMEQGEVAEDDEDPWDWVPVDSPVRNGNKLLAQRLAAGIADMVARGDAVADRETRRPRRCGYGDVMILVRRRGPLFHEIIRALKSAAVPVAGADRLKLSEHGVYEDLMALGRFVRFPADDLSLAVLLRSPFCDVGEQGLYDLAYERRGGLWGALRSRAGDCGEWADAVRLLTWAREEAERVPPFDFYCSVLGRIDPAGRSMRQRILTRLGAEGEQALEAFVGQVLAAEASGVRDLESLLAWMGALDLDIKREQQEGGAGEVRVMTVHGAKGLEAPIVILPDTTSRATWQGGRLLALADGAFLWAPRKDDDGPASTLAKQIRDEAMEQESSRLLYVALTRARDRLIVAGVEPLQPWRFQRSWRDYVERAFAALETAPFELPGGGEGRRYGPAPAPSLAEAELPLAGVALPAWTFGLAAPETPAARRAAPSRLDEDDAGSAPSPLADVGGLGRYRRGDIIHRLLQLLPDLPAERRADAAAALMAREPDLDGPQRAEMAAAALAMLADPRFAAVFGPGSRPEIPLVGQVGALAISGRVDRLLVETDRVLVIDFKTNRPAPVRIEDADGAYVRQMAIYAAILAEVFPGRAIEAALVWTDGPALMPIPPALLAAALEQLDSPPPGFAGPPPKGGREGLR